VRRKKPNSTKRYNMLFICNIANAAGLKLLPYAKRIMNAIKLCKNSTNAAQPTYFKSQLKNRHREKPSQTIENKKVKRANIS